jgi:UDP-2,4-diacetamido-2,4,6-trideoxy-beta-L-altropyranose hydrolase
MKVAIRVDSSVAMGTGHLARCRTLARALRNRGARIQFICRRYDGNIASTLDDFEVALLPSTPSALSRSVDEQTRDASETQAALSGARPDYLIVDHYQLSAPFEVLMRDSAEKIMVIDDLADRRHDCDILLDQNYFRYGAARYRGLVPQNCLVLSGPRYSLLRPEFLQARDEAIDRPQRVRNILIYMGGSDPEDMTGAALEALTHRGLDDLEVEVVLGPNHPCPDKIRSLADRSPNVRMYDQQPHLADLLSSVDLAIGAGGATLWERLCMGVPSVVVSIAGNQRGVCEELDRDGYINYAGHSQEVGSATLVQVLERLSVAQLQRQSLAGRALVDGYGTGRVAEALMPQAREDVLNLRPARDADVFLYFGWVNDPVVRAASLQSSPVSLHDHLAWYRAKLADPATHLLVLQLRDLPIGQIRFDLEGDRAEVDYSLDVLFRGRGLGAQLVEMGMNWLRDHCRCRPIVSATVRTSNEASLHTFRRLGFREGATGDETILFQSR